MASTALRLHGVAGQLGLATVAGKGWVVPSSVDASLPILYIGGSTGGTAACAALGAISSAALASGRASPGGRLVVAATAGSGSGAEGRDDSNSEEYTKLGDFDVHDIIMTQAFDALYGLGDLLPATAKEKSATKYDEVKTGLAKAFRLAQGRSNQMGAALELMQGWYGIVELAHASYPDASLPALPGKQAFLDLCLAAGDESVILGQAVAPLMAPLQVHKIVGCGMPDSDVDLIRSVFTSVCVCQAAAKTARANYGSDEPYIV